jgi:hypothetical protein
MAQMRTAVRITLPLGEWRGRSPAANAPAARGGEAVANGMFKGPIVHLHAEAGSARQVTLAGQSGHKRLVPCFSCFSGFCVTLLPVTREALIE